MVDMLFSLIKDLIFRLFFSSFGRGAKIHFFVIWQGLGYFFSANTFVKKQSSPLDRVPWEGEEKKNQTSGFSRWQKRLPPPSFRTAWFPT